MARLSGVDLPRDKRLEVALTYIYGIGRTRALQTLEATGVSGDTRVNSLTDDDLMRVSDLASRLMIIRSMPGGTKEGDKHGRFYDHLAIYYALKATDAFGRSYGTRV